MEEEQRKEYMRKYQKGRRLQIKLESYIVIKDKRWKKKTIKARDFDFKKHKLL